MGSHSLRTETCVQRKRRSIKCNTLEYKQGTTSAYEHMWACREKEDAGGMK